MKLFDRKTWTLIAGVFVLATACTSEREGFQGTNAPLRGMVYNLDRLPVLDVSVALVANGHESALATTDVHGRFGLPSIPFGDLTLRFTKEGYEALTWKFSFRDPTQVVYVQMASFDELLDQAAEAIQHRDPKVAGSALDRAEKLQPQSLVVQFLKAQNLAAQGKPEEAAKALERMSSQETSSLAVELALADLYQYRLNKPTEALNHLRKAVSIQNDPDLLARVQLLEQAAAQEKS